jgi:hypothetical protein
MNYVNHHYNTRVVPDQPAYGITPLTPSSTSTGTAAGGSALSWMTNSLTVDRNNIPSTFYSTRVGIFGTDNAMQGSVNSSAGLLTLYKSESFAVVKGQTYNFSFNYFTDDWAVKPLTAIVDGVEMAVPVPVGLGETVYSTGQFTGTNPS